MSPAVTGVAAGMLLALTLTAGAGAQRVGRAAPIRARLRRVGAPVGADRRRPAWLRAAPPRAIAVRLADAAPEVDAGLAVAAWATCVVVAVGVGAAIGGVGLGAGAAIAAVGAPVLGYAGRRGAAGRALEAALPDALESVARSLRSGAGSRQALAETAPRVPGPLGVELRAVVASLDAGVDLVAALGELERRRPLPGIRLAVAALLLGAEAGGAHARALDGVAASVRARLGVSREVRALSSQARLSAVVIAAAPAGFAAGADAASARFLFRTPVGVACLSLGLALDVAGAWWMHRLAQVEP